MERIERLGGEMMHGKYGNVKHVLGRRHDSLEYDRFG
jgi:hypothetical protein